MKRQGLDSPGINEGFSRGLFLQEERGSYEASCPHPMAGLTLPPRTECSFCCSSAQGPAMAALGITFKLPHPPLTSTPTSHHSSVIQTRLSWLDNSGLCISDYTVSLPPGMTFLSTSVIFKTASSMKTSLQAQPI